MKKMVSGIKPSGPLTLGNYIGALKNFVLYQDEYKLFVFIANLHCITVYQPPKELEKNLFDAVALYLACGLDPAKTTIFLQSDVPEHAQLGFILSCNAYLGELNRMTQYKDRQHEPGLSVGFYTYPTLMAADILLYQPAFVPVGHDQKQHVELTRDIAERFNQRYGPTFEVPEPLIAEVGARIMSLSDPSKKMSKSDESDKGCIYLLDDPKVASKKIMSAVTDSYNEINYDPIKQPGVSNLLVILASLTTEPIEAIVKRLSGAGYGVLKKEVAQAVSATLTEIQTNYQKIIHSDLIEQTLSAGQKKASQLAHSTLASVQTKIGLEIKKP